MTAYNYSEAIKDDVLEYIRENIDYSEFDDLDDLREFLYDELFIEDSVTGNASGSYTFSTWQAEEYIAHNLDLLEEAAQDFGADLGNLLSHGAEACDVTIRCYLLGGAIDEALEEIEEEFDETHK